jgi:hypothetical protein
MVVLSIAIGAIGTLLKTLFAQNAEKQAEQDRAIKELTTNFNRLPMEFVLKDDYIRAMTNIDYKLDGVSKDVKDLRTEVVEALKGLGGGDGNGKHN